MEAWVMGQEPGRRVSCPWALVPHSGLIEIPPLQQLYIGLNRIASNLSDACQLNLNIQRDNAKIKCALVKNSIEPNHFKVEWHRGELYPRVGVDPLRGSSVTNLSRPAARVTKFYNGRGTAEQHIKEGKHAINWTRLSCHSFRNNAV